ncbi:MAG TPA: prepilin-type N-terminal cleavage/methylation domain-containing protein [candidate division Zixibacteria bacterium]|nr:prepilin-type N-terminal cleavage/methylation domain-containing protein [candidate division Zixibacteria bacterium]
MRKRFNSKGYTILELLISLAMTSVIALAGYKFYASMHNSALTQEEISDLQQNSRNVLQEIARTARMAGYKVGGHTPYEISGDSLAIYFNQTQPVDTVLFFLEDYADADMMTVNGLTESNRPKRLMRKVNSDAAIPYSDLVRSISYNAPTSNSLEITLVVQTSKADESFVRNSGVRTYTFTERVIMRNLNL